MNLYTHAVCFWSTEKGCLGGEIVKLNNNLKKDRSGVSAIIVVVIVAVVVIAAVAAAFIVASGDKDKELEIKMDVLAPGTVLKYDLFVDGEKYGIMEIQYVGQNAKEYLALLKMAYEGDDEYAVVYYDVDPKELPDGSKRTGTVEMDTIDGKKKLEVVEYEMSELVFTSKIKAYVDPSNGVPYKVERKFSGTTETQILAEKEIILQESYEESEHIGLTYEYDFEYMEIGFKFYLVCAVDCLEDRYGILMDLSSFPGGVKAYILSNYPQGMHVDAKDTKKKTTLKGTIDGDVEVEIWEAVDVDDSKITYYCERNSKVIYKMVLSGEGFELIFDLAKKPETAE
jgi:hypothetical protein